MHFLISSLLLMFVMGTMAHSNGSVKVSLDREFKLRFGQAVRLRGEELRVEFDSVKEDSRCPQGVDCIWAGNARITLKLSKAGRQPATLELNTGVEPHNASYMNYDVRLVNLSPYPQANRSIAKKSYVATLSIRKK